MYASTQRFERARRRGALALTALSLCALSACGGPTEPDQEPGDGSTDGANNQTAGANNTSSPETSGDNNQSSSNNTASANNTSSSETSGDNNQTTPVETTSPNNTSGAHNAGEPIEVLGQWASAWGREQITEQRWGRDALIENDNAGNWAVTQTAEDADYNPGLYNKIVWTEPDAGGFYYCVAAFGLESAEEARQTEGVSDATDPSMGGCGESDFAWTRLVANDEIEIAGQWRSNFDADEEISSTSWDFGYYVADLIGFNNAQNVAVTQNPSDAEYDPDKFSRVVWTEPEQGSFYYCTVEFGLESAEEAWASEAVADPTDLDGAGCGGSPWTRLMERN